ncbi:protein phosphatase 2C domain-containing protein [Marivibrio halodurans]|uniref:Protein phosphatase 2C domain-containing protein n=1 Tax=Marivibrio halodurans TaxID=2039722 RepID=A0A8J7V4I3_9PROT|nr:PP2C family serine/threonine-protein phosphatase [Marivibrio halodurans]MBP5857719.1 protein phosphatase 2C domain-containing protein [Marivibrio halodurans]
MSWVAALDFAQGRHHRAAGVPCQDFGRVVHPAEDVLLGAIADGAGSAALGHLGAQAAVGAAIALLGPRLGANPGLRGDPAGGPGGADALFDGLLEAARAAISETARHQGRPIDALATTLTVFAAGPLGVAVFQIGDGWIVSRGPEGDYALVGHPQRGEYANETVFVTGADAEETLAITHIAEPIRFLCAATDGLTHVSIAAADDRPHAAFFQPLDSFIASTEDAADAHRAIRGFLRSEGLRARVEDDVTLMLGGWHPLGRA